MIAGGFVEMGDLRRPRSMNLARYSIGKSGKCCFRRSGVGLGRTLFGEKVELLSLVLNMSCGPKSHSVVVIFFYQILW